MTRDELDAEHRKLDRELDYFGKFLIISMLVLASVIPLSLVAVIVFQWWIHK